MKEHSQECLSLELSEVQVGTYETPWLRMFEFGIKATIWMSETVYNWNYQHLYFTTFAGGEGAIVGLPRC